MANSIDASNAYLNILKQVGGGAEAKTAPAGGPSFGDVLKSSVESAIGAQHKSEQVSAAAITGNANMTEVLKAVNDAELALNTVLAVRDRLVQAYDEIMRTPV